MNTDVTQTNQRPIVDAPIDSLHLWAKNPRAMSRRNFENLMRSVQEFGLDPIKVNRIGNIVISGHQRLRAARELGYKTVPVQYYDLDEKGHTRLALAMNDPKFQGSNDDDMLAELLHELDTPDLEWLDISAEELDKLQDGYVDHDEPADAGKSKNTSSKKWDIQDLREAYKSYADAGGKNNAVTFIGYLETRT